MSKYTLILWTAVLCLLFAAQTPGQTGGDFEPVGLDPAALDRLAERGWKVAGDGLLRARRADGSSRLLAYDSAGLEVAVEHLQKRLNFMLRLHLEDPRPEGREVVEGLLSLIEKHEARIAAGWTAVPFLTKAAAGCVFDVDASVTTSRCVQTSSADAFYDDICFGECTAHTWAYIQRRDCDGNNDWVTDSCDSEQGNTVFCSSSVSSNLLSVGTPLKSCHGAAEGYLDCSAGFGWPDEIAETFSCPFKCAGCPDDPGPEPEPEPTHG